MLTKVTSMAMMINIGLEVAILIYLQEARHRCIGNVTSSTICTVHHSGIFGLIFYKLTPYMIIMPTVIHTYYEGFTLTKQEECRLLDSCLPNDIFKKNSIALL